MDFHTHTIKATFFPYDLFNEFPVNQSIRIWCVWGVITISFYHKLATEKSNKSIYLNTN